MDNPAGKRTGAVVGKSGEDFVQTPRIAVEKLLEVEWFGSGVIWEPACGKGAISRVLEERLPFAEVWSTDLVDRGYGTGGVDFLTCNTTVPNIVTNAPFSLLAQFIEQGLRLTTRKLVLFTRFSALAGSKARIDIFRKNRPTRAWGFYGKIPYVTADDVEVPSPMDFAWVVWDKQFPSPKTTLDWL